MPSAELLNILACPVCKGTLTPLEETSSLFCRQCGLSFPTRDGIPVLLADDAQRTT